MKLQASDASAPEGLQSQNLSRPENRLSVNGLAIVHGRLIFLSSCGAEPECDSIETRNAVLQIVSDDHRNPLETYAAKNSNVTHEKSSAAKLENAKPLYLLGEKIVTTSTSKDKRTLTCSGEISVSVGDLKASKEMNFTVQQKSDGKLSVSVEPFQF